MDIFNGIFPVYYNELKCQMVFDIKRCILLIFLKVFLTRKNKEIIKKTPQKSDFK